MKAAVYRQHGGIEAVSIEKPELKGNGAIIKVHGCGLCGSDIVKMKQGVESGAILGHEVVGEIVEVSSKNQDFKVGNRVVLGHHVPCGNCVFCEAENYSMCRGFKATNIVPGGFCEYIYVSDAHLDNTVLKVPENLTDVEASFTEPSACCLRAVKRANVQLGDNVLIIGLGSIGLIMGQIAKHFGANVSGCDLIDERLELADEVGFDSVYRYTNLEETSISYKLTTNNIGADKVFLCSGSLSSIPLAISAVRDGGTILVFASVTTSNGVFSNNDIYFRELTVMGSYSPAPVDLCESLDLIAGGIIKVDKFSKAYNLENINEAVEDTLSNKIIKAFIKI